jgi:hypothetical protein
MSCPAPTTRPHRGQAAHAAAPCRRTGASGEPPCCDATTSADAPGVHGAESSEPVTGCPTALASPPTATTSATRTTTHSPTCEDSAPPATHTAADGRADDLRRHGEA